MSLGQFYSVASPLHALDPRTKLLSMALLALGLFFVGSVAGLLVLAVALAAAVVVSGVPPRFFLRLLRPVAFVVVLTVAFQVLVSRDGKILFGWGVLEVHAEGVVTGAFLALRMLLLVSAAGLLTATTAPISLADGIEILLSPLERFRLPVHEVAMMMTIALRFIPTLDEEARRIIRAQAARGADFAEGGPLRRGREMLPVLIPLTVGAFRRADELAEAMESRGYRGGEGRTRYRKLRFRSRDAVALLATAFVLTGSILL